MSAAPALPPKPWFTDGISLYAVTMTADGQPIMWISHNDGRTWAAMLVAKLI